MKTNFNSKLLLVLAVVLLICILFDFLALHDIHNDYVSKAVIDRFSASTSNSFPDWTNTTGEWSVVRLSFIVKLVAIAFTFIAIFASSKNFTSQE
jgi:hypothetical protein